MLLSNKNFRETCEFISFYFFLSEFCNNKIINDIILHCDNCIIIYHKFYVKYVFIFNCKYIKYNIHSH